MRRLMTSFGSALAVASVLSLTQAFSQEEAEKTAKPAAKGAASDVHTDADSSAIPECLEKLKLSAKQQEQVKKINQEYEESLGMVWKQFGDHYMKTIKLESSMLAAIEDNLTEAQRQQVRDERRKMAKPDKAPAGKPGKHADAAEKEIEAAGVTLTHDQEVAADRVHQKYRDHLRSLNHSIHNLHSQLVSLEADKLVEIEKVLTKEQLTQLRASRASAPAAKVTATEPEAATEAEAAKPE